MKATKIEIDSELLNRILQLPSLQSLPRRKIAAIISKLECFRVEPKTEIFNKHQVADFFYWTIDGTIRFEGDSRTQTASSGETFGEESLQQGGVYLHKAVSDTQSLVVRLSADRARSLLTGTTTLQNVLSVLMQRLTGNEVVKTQSSSLVADTKSDRIKVVGWLATIILPPLLFVWGRSFITDDNQLVFLCISLATVLMWGFRLMSEFIPSIFAILAILILNIAPAKVALVGFTDGSFYLALSIFGLSSLIVSSGLAFRMVLWMLRIVPVSSRWHAFSLFLIGTILTPLLPSANGRIALMMPVLKDLIDSSEYKSKSKAGTYLFMSGFAGFTMLSTIFLSSKTIHFVIFGLLPQQVKERFSWGYWLLASLVAGIVLVIGLFGLMEYFNRDREKPKVTREEIRLQYQAFGPMSLSEWAALIGIMLFMVGIMTESLHKIQLPWIGLMVLYATLAVGFLTPKQLRINTDWTFLIYLGTLIGFVSTISYLGLDKQVGVTFSFLGHYMKNEFGLFVVILSVTMILLRFFVPTNTAVAILASVLFPMAQALGVNPWVIGFILLMLSDIWFFPYQCTYYLQIESQVMKDPNFDLPAFYRFNALSNIVRMAAIFASIPFWRWLGLL